MPGPTPVPLPRRDAAAPQRRAAGEYRQRSAGPSTALSWPALALLVLALLAGAAGGCGPGDDTPRGLYRSQCARCHGLDGQGNPRAVKTQEGLDLRRSELLAAGDREGVRRLVVEGEGTMPAFGEKLTPEQIDALVTLSFELAGRVPPPATRAPEKRNPEERTHGPEPAEADLRQAP